MRTPRPSQKYVDHDRTGECVFCREPKRLSSLFKHQVRCRDNPTRKQWVRRYWHEEQHNTFTTPRYQSDTQYCEATFAPVRHEHSRKCEPAHTGNFNHDVGIAESYANSNASEIETADSDDSKSSNGQDLLSESCIDSSSDNESMTSDAVTNIVTTQIAYDEINAHGISDEVAPTIETSRFRLDTYINEYDADIAKFSVDFGVHGNAIDGLYSMLKSWPILRSVKFAGSERNLKKLEAKNEIADLGFIRRDDLNPALPDSVKNKLKRKMLMRFTLDKPLIRKCIVTTAVELCSRPHLWPYLITKPERFHDSSGSNLYHGFSSGRCFKDAYDSLNNKDAEILPFLLFSDATHFLRGKRSQMHPIYMAPMGVPQNLVNIESIVLVGFIPSYPTLKKFLNSSEKSDYAQWKRTQMCLIYHSIISDMFAKFRYGVFVVVNGHKRLLHPIILTTISDHPEGNSLAMIDMLQCRYCLGQPEKYADIDLEWSHRSCNSRNVAQMREKYRMSRHTDWAIPYNIMWDCRAMHFNVFATGHCLFHDIDEDTFIMLSIVFSPGLLGNRPGHLAEFVRCLHGLSKVSGLKCFSQLDKESYCSLTATEKRHLLIQLPLAFAQYLFVDVLHDPIFMLYLSLMKWYEFLRRHTINDNDIISMNTAWSTYHTQLMETYLYYTGVQYESCAIKHHVGCHYGGLTKYLAPMINLSCEKFDSAHRIIIKRNMKTHQGRFYEDLVVERETRRDLTRIHRLSTKLDTGYTSDKKKRVKKPIYQGSIQNFLHDPCSSHLSSSCKQDFVRQIHEIHFNDCEYLIELSWDIMVFSNVRIGESRRQLIQANDTRRSIVSFSKITPFGTAQCIGEVSTIVTLVESEYCLIRSFFPSDVHSYITSVGDTVACSSQLRPSLQALQDAYEVLCDERDSSHVLIPIKNVNQIEQVAWLGALHDTSKGSHNRHFCLFNKYVNSSLLSSKLSPKVGDDDIE